MQTDFIALYRGQTVAEARLVAVTAEPQIVSRFVRELGGEAETTEDWGEAGPNEPPRLVKEDRVES